MNESSVNEIVDLIVASKGSAPKICLLIGAGCSVSADIPLASGLVDRIRKDYPTAYRKAEKKCEGDKKPNYGQCMAELKSAYRRKLVNEYVSNAKINWAHIAIACLIEKRIVDRVLTVNFDPLVSRACALLNQFPAVYDFGATGASDFDAGLLEGCSVFHLHGQHTGFILLNTEEKLRVQAEKLSGVIADSVRGRLCIVVGYSGENDPLISKLAEHEYPYGLFWVQHDDEDPPGKVCENILAKDDASLIRNAPADTFLVDLARGLEAYPPPFLENPYTHLEGVFQTIAPLKRESVEAKETDVLEKVRLDIHNTKISYDRRFGPAGRIRSLVVAKNFEKALEIFGSGELNWRKDSELRDNFFWAHMGRGNQVIEEIDALPEGEGRLRLLKEGRYLAKSMMEIALEDLENRSLLGAFQASFSRVESKSRRRRTLNQGLANLTLAYDAGVHSAVYNLACAYCLKDHEEKSKKYLHEAFELHFLPSKQHLLIDKDIDSIRSKRWFKNFLKKAFPEKAETELATPARKKQPRPRKKK